VTFYVLQGKSSDDSSLELQVKLDGEFATTIGIISFYQDKKQNIQTLKQQLFGDTRCLFGSRRRIKTRSRSIRLNNLVHDASDFDIRIIFVPVFKGAKLH